MPDVLILALVIFILALSVAIIVFTVNFAEFLKELTKTTASVRALTDLTTNELKPALKSLNEVLATLTKVSSATNKHFEMVRNILTTLLGASCVALTNVKSKGGFFSGLMSGFNMFRKKGDKKCQ